MSALVRIRIEKDGRVSNFTIVRPSGNVVVDESVAAVAKRVTQVDPLPKGLGGAYYEVNINFELNPENSTAARPKWRVAYNSASDFPSR